MYPYIIFGNSRYGSHVPIRTVPRMPCLGGEDYLCGPSQSFWLGNFHDITVFLRMLFNDGLFGFHEILANMYSSSQRSSLLLIFFGSKEIREILRHPVRRYCRCDHCWRGCQGRSRALPGLGSVLAGRLRYQRRFGCLTMV